MSDKTKDIIRKILMLIAVIAIIFSGYKLYEIRNEEYISQTVNTDIEKIIGKKDKPKLQNDSKEEKLEFLTKDSFNELKAINDDFKGYLYYPSLDIYEHVVQAADNDFYLERTFYKEFSPYGTIFIDGKQSMNQQNTTLYGHWVSNSSLKFSDLHKLKQQENYEQYKTFFYVDDEFIHEYEVGVVLYHHSTDDYDNIPYMEGNFTEEEFDTFINSAKDLQFYDIGSDFDYNDKIMTLQTCISFESEERLVVLAKEINKTEIKDK